MATSQKKLKNELRNSGIDVTKLFPKSKINRSRNFTPYQLRKIKKALQELRRPPGTTGSFRPDRPDHYEAAGFKRDGKIIYTASEKIKIHTVYKSEGESSFYSASIFAGEIHCQLIPLFKLPDFLEAQIALDDEHGQFYDKITLREGDRDMWGQAQGFNSMRDSAEEMYLWMIEYKRHGALIGGGDSFDYIQVCFVIFGDR